MATSEPCPGRENRRYREAWDAYRQAIQDYDPLDPDQSRPKPPDIRPRPGEPVWCPDCKTLIVQRLAELDDLAAMLDFVADGHHSAEALERVTRSSEPASPSQAADDLNELHTMLYGWEMAYRDIQRWPSPPRRGELASRETSCIAWLSHHLPGILASPVAKDFGTEVLQWHRSTAGQAKAGVRTLKMPLRCPGRGCGLLTLFWTEGGDRVECQSPACGLILSREQYETEVGNVAGAIERGELEPETT
jgi:hypothetical protein